MSPDPAETATRPPDPPPAATNITTVTDSPPRPHVVWAEGVLVTAGIQLGREVGRGGMGVVYAAHDSEFNRDIAIKVLSPDTHGSEKAADRFRTEAGITARLQHPGVVPVYACSPKGEGRPFFTMKLVRGRTLAAHLDERSDPDQDRPQFLKWFEQIAQTVAYAHTRMITHRDLKPANVMVGAFGEVFVMDWGLAGEHDGEDAYPGNGAGTPAYMPPEQANKTLARLGHPTDVFALGSILCEVLTGRPAYVGTLDRSALDRAKAADLADARSRLAGCGADPELVALCERCLAPNPVDRPADAGAVAAVVTTHLESVAARLRDAEVAQATAEASAAAARDRARAERTARRRGLALVAGLIIGAAVGCGGWLLVQNARSEQARSEAERALTAERADRERDRAASAEARSGLLAAQRDAAADLSIDDVRAAEALTLVVQEWQRTPDAQHVVRKIQLLQSLGRLAFADTPRAREAALQSWRRLEEYLRTQVWFPTFLDDHRAELDTVARADASPAARRVALLEISTALRRAAEEFGEGQYLAPLKRFQGEWYAQADRAAGRLADAARAGRPLDEVRSYARLFWRLYSAETVLVEEEAVARAMVAVGRQLDRWDQAGPGAAPAGLDADLRAAVEVYRTAYRAELARAKK